jgi:hypothetical protein
MSAAGLDQMQAAQAAQHRKIQTTSASRQRQAQTDKTVPGRKPGRGGSPASGRHVAGGSIVRENAHEGQ